MRIFVRRIRSKRLKSHLAGKSDQEQQYLTGTDRSTAQTSTQKLPDSRSGKSAQLSNKQSGTRTNMISLSRLQPASQAVAIPELIYTDCASPLEDTFLSVSQVILRNASPSTLAFKSLQCAFFFNAGPTIFQDRNAGFGTLPVASSRRESAGSAEAVSRMRDARRSASPRKHFFVELRDAGRIQ
jgi:hypothetical protein